jgi:hypothetical protein
VHGIKGTKEGDVRLIEEALLSRYGFLRLCGGGLAGLVGFMMLGAAGCGSGEDQQDDRQDVDQQDDQQHTNQQDAVWDVDRCPQRC